MIFDTIRYGTFTAEDFMRANKSDDFSKFTSLPVDLRKQFISNAIDLYKSRHNKDYKQAAFDFIDGKITEGRFQGKFWNYWGNIGVGLEVAAVAGATTVAATNYHVGPYFDQHASLLNKLIKEYEYVN
jgi:hypothetical protein